MIYLLYILVNIQVFNNVCFLHVINLKCLLNIHVSYIILKKNCILKYDIFMLWRNLKYIILSDKV